MKQKHWIFNQMGPRKGDYFIAKNHGYHLLSTYQVSVQHYVKCHTDLSNPYKPTIEQMRKLRLKNRLSKFLQINKSIKGKARFLPSLWAIPFYSTAPQKIALEMTTSASPQNLLEIKISNPIQTY